MSRPWRIEFSGALYHILSRGNEQGDLFLDNEDRNDFISLIGEISNRFNVNVFAYVLMDNYYHILLRTNRPNLSRTMQWMGVTYTRRFNNRHGSSGHLFQGRFKSLIVENDAYLIELSCYIHRNPLRAGMVRRLMDYKWSSYRAYAYGMKAPLWLKTRIILSQFGNKDPQPAYRRKVQRYSGEEASLFEELRYGLFFGTASFADKLKSRYSREAPHPEVPQQSRLVKDHEPEKLIGKLSVVLGCNPEIFRESLRISEADKSHRDLMVYFLWQTGRFSNRKIAELFRLLPKSCTKYRSEAQKALCLKRSWSDFDPQAYYLYGEDENHETSFKGKAFQAVVDSWCKIQVLYSSVSKRAGIVRKRLREEKTFKDKFDQLNALIKL